MLDNEEASPDKVDGHEMTDLGISKSTTSMIIGHKDVSNVI